MTLVFKGRVSKGMGKGSFFTSLSWFSDQVYENLGYKPFPGTLNLQIPANEAEKLQQYFTQGIEVNPSDPNYCGAVCHPILIDGVIWGALVKPIATTHPPETVEIVAPVSIRESLNLSDGDWVTFCSDNGPKPWNLCQEEKLADYRILEVHQRKATSPRLSQDFDFYALKSPDWVQILPITTDEKVLMVRQFRHGTREITLELPGGLVEEGMSPANAAQKELAEEVGYTSQKLTFLGKARPNPAILTNWCYFFLAEELIVEQRPQDDGEDLYLMPVSLKKIPGLIKAGLINHSLAVTGFYHLWAR